MSAHARSRKAGPGSDRPFSVEARGLDPVPDEERHGRPAELFWVWLAANLGIIGIVYGAIIATFGLDLVQGIAVAIVGSVLSFLLVGVLGVAGVKTGAPMLVLSRICFGRRGNIGPAVVSWLSLVGWETVTAVVAADALEALVEKSFHLPAADALTVGCLVAVASVSLALGRFGHATIVAVQRFVAWTFGILTLAICPVLVRRAHWSSLLGGRPGSYLALLSALSIVVASGGISWANLSADYTRYLPRAASARKVVLWTSFGATVPLGILVVVGVMLASTIPGLADAANPVAAIGSILPSWMEIPYLLAALVGLVSQMVMALYSSGLGLLVLGVRVRRSRTVLIDAAVVVLAGSFFTVVRQGFLGPFVSFVELLACPIATWAAVLVVDMALRRRRYAQGWANGGLTAGPRLSAVLAWVIGSVLGLCCTASPLFTGPIARGIFAGSSLGYFLGFFVSALIYLVAETAGAWLARRAVRLQGQVQPTG